MHSSTLKHCDSHTARRTAEHMTREIPGIYIACCVSETGPNSLAVVATDGAEYHAESTANCAELREQLLAYFTEVRDSCEHLVVAYDDDAAWHLLVGMLCDVPDWLCPCNIGGHINDAVFKDFFEITQKSKSDPLWRARALRSAHTVEKRLKLTLGFHPKLSPI
jgi:hypothetical protein